MSQAQLESDAPPEEQPAAPEAEPEAVQPVLSHTTQVQVQEPGEEVKAKSKSDIKIAAKVKSHDQLESRPSTVQAVRSTEVRVSEATSNEAPSVETKGPVAEGAVGEGPATEVAPTEVAESPSGKLVRTPSKPDASKRSSTLRTTSSTLNRSSLIYKHDFSAMGLPKDGSKEESTTGIKKGMGSKGKLALGSIISIHRASLTGDQFDKFRYSILAKNSTIQIVMAGKQLDVNQQGFMVNLVRYFQKKLEHVGPLHPLNCIHKAARYMNTYRLESENPFNPEKVEKILEAIVIEALENLTYEPDKCAKQAKWASSAIRAAVKDLKYDRYKLICLMTIGEKNSQDVFATCRFLWDIERDRYAVYAHENTYVYGYAQCFGLYYE